MSEDKVFWFRVEGGVITEARQMPIINGYVFEADVTKLTERGDIEDAVARVANTPVSGKEND